MKNISLLSTLSLYVVVSLAAPISSQDVVELKSRQLFSFLRGLAGGVRKAAKGLPEKAGKKTGKNMGNGEDNVIDGKLQDAMDRWSKFLGKEQDPKCVQGWMNTFSRNGRRFYPSANEMAGKKAVVPQAILPAPKPAAPKKATPKKSPPAPKKPSSKKATLKKPSGKKPTARKTAAKEASSTKAHAKNVNASKPTTKSHAKKNSPKKAATKEHNTAKKAAP
ncbi:hypothetical protein CPC08DRAFT_770077 [Agrocybe pediades]|nr:hypothetical protein CPC08DRAFT_770077 [Agrocybe pediades]